MAIEFDCPTCQTRIRTPDEAAGKKARCPTCQAIVPIPARTGFAPLSGLSSAPTSAPATSKPQPPPPAAQAPWLPPADAFAPKGSVAGSIGPQPRSSNPFGDGTGMSPQSGAMNPYASPSAYASAEAFAFTKEEIRQKLLGPAIGLALSSLLCLAAVFGFALLIVMSPDFQRDMQNNGNQPEIIAACIILAVLTLAGALPYFIALLGAYAMYRGRGALAAWIGAIAGVLPCNPFWFLTTGFAIWGMVVLNDSRVQEGMK